jgi:CRISPR type I-D-associated protein Csc3/Cas10d
LTSSAALILPLALDVKVVASESPTPLMTEADELDETVFMDGVRPMGIQDQERHKNI